MRKEKQKRAAKSIWIEPVHEVPLIFLRFPGNSFYTGKKKEFLSLFLPSLKPRRQDVDYVWQLPHTLLSIILESRMVKKSSRVSRETHVIMIGCKKCEFSKYIPLKNYQFWDRYRCSKPLPAARGGQFITGDGFANYRGPCWSRRLTYGARVPEACRRLLARVRKELQDVLWSAVNDRRYRDRLSFCDFREENRMPLLHACRIYFRSELSEPEFLYFWSLMPIACPSPLKSHESQRCMLCVLDYAFVSRRFRISSIERLGPRRVISYVAEQKLRRTVDWSHWSSNKIGNCLLASKKRRRKPFAPSVSKHRYCTIREIWRGVRWFEKTDGIPLFRKITCIVAQILRLLRLFRDSFFSILSRTRRADPRELRGSKWNYRP